MTINEISHVVGIKILLKKIISKKDKKLREKGEMCQPDMIELLSAQMSYDDDKEYPLQHDMYTDDDEYDKYVIIGIVALHLSLRDYGKDKTIISINQLNNLKTRMETYLKAKSIPFSEDDIQVYTSTDDCGCCS